MYPPERKVKEGILSNNKKKEVKKAEVFSERGTKIQKNKGK